MKHNTFVSYLIIIVCSLVATAGLLAMTEDDLKWVVGYFAVIAFAMMFAMYPDKKKFLFISLFIGFAIQTSVFIWQPAPMMYYHGNGPVNAPEVYIFDLPLALLAIYVFSMKNKNRSNEFIKSDILAALLILFYVLSMVKSEHLLLSLSGILVMLRMPLIYYCMSRGLTSGEEMRPIITTLLLLLGIQGFIGIGQALGVTIPVVSFLVKEHVQAIGLHIGHFMYIRPYGTIGYTTIYAQYMGMLFPLALTFYLFEMKSWMRWLYGLIVVLGLLGILFSLSRIEWINLVMVFILLMVMRKVQKTYPLKISGHKILVMVVGMAIIGMAFSQRITERIILPDQGSAIARLLMTTVAFNMIYQNPIFGVGINTYVERMYDYGMAAILPGENFGVHNSFLYLAAETGLFSLMTMLLIWFVGFRRLWFCITHSGRQMTTLFAIGLFCGMWALFVHSMVEPGYHCIQNLGGMIWSFFGLAAALTVITKKDLAVGREDGG